MKGRKVETTDQRIIDKKEELKRLPEEDAKLIKQASRSPYIYYSNGAKYRRQKPRTSKGYCIFRGGHKRGITL